MNISRHIEQRLDYLAIKINQVLSLNQDISTFDYRPYGFQISSLRHYTDCIAACRYTLQTPDGIEDMLDFLDNLLHMNSTSSREIEQFVKELQIIKSDMYSNNML